MRNKVIDIYQSGKGYKAISKALGIQRTTVRAIIYKQRTLGTVVYLPRSGRTITIPLRAHQQLILEFTKEPRLKNCRPHLPQLRSVFTIPQ